MDADQLKTALFKIADLQPGLVFDVVVGQLAAQRREIEKRNTSQAPPLESVNYDEITMKRSGKGYIIEGHLYEGDRHDKEKGRIYLKCHKVKNGCKSRARIFGNVATVLQRKHNHAPPNIIEMRFWNIAREEATKEEHKNKPMTQVYDTAKRVFLAQAKDDEERKLWLQNIPSFRSVESTMRFKKSKVFTAPVKISMLDKTFDTLRRQILDDSSTDGNNAEVAQGYRDNSEQSDSGTTMSQSENRQASVIGVTFDTPQNQTPNSIETHGSNSQQSNTLSNSTNNSETTGSCSVENSINAIFLEPSNISQGNNMQERTDLHGNVGISTGTSMDMSNVGIGNSSATTVQSLLAISDQLQQL